ncbi:uncharacterized [Tachysurus ichikawai]
MRTGRFHWLRDSCGREEEGPESGGLLRARAKRGRAAGKVHDTGSVECRAGFSGICEKAMVDFTVRRRSYLAQRDEGPVGVAFL